jgi:FlaG/FlaF family flagellin (archaellin)
MWDDPEYHYSSKLNTCLIHIRYVDQSFALSSLKVSYQYNQVIDIFSNKVILYGYFERSVDNNTEKTIDTFHANIPNYTSIEYFKHKDKLFSE